MGRPQGTMALRATMAKRGMFDAILTPMANVYMGMYGKQLKKFGLRFEDVYVETPEVMEAVGRLSPAEQEERSMRIKRAIDLSFKKTYLPSGMQAAHDPFKVYLADNLKQVEDEVWEQTQFDREHRPL